MEEFERWALTKKGFKTWNDKLYYYGHDFYGLDKSIVGKVIREFNNVGKVDQLNCKESYKIICMLNK